MDYIREQQDLNSMIESVFTENLRRDAEHAGNSAPNSEREQLPTSFHNGLPNLSIKQNKLGIDPFQFKILQNQYLKSLTKLESGILDDNCQQQFLDEIVQLNSHCKHRIENKERSKAV